MRALRLLPAVLAFATVLACGDSGDGDGRRPTKLPAEGDATILQEVLDGTATVEDAFLRIAHSGGFPIPTSQGFLFAHPDGGDGPYAVVSPTDAFAPVAMTEEAGIWWALVPLEAPEGLRYRLARGSGAAFADPWARRFTYVATREQSVVAVAAGTGHLERWPGVADASGTIPARALRVWVPAETPTHFLYAHDGQNLFSSGASYGGWRLQDAAGPRTLVVGIDNGGGARLSEYAHVDERLGTQDVPARGDAYAAYVEETVRPFVEARYGTPGVNGVIGSSMGGLISLHQGLLAPDRWDFVASLSGTVGWGRIGLANETIIERYAALGACPAPFVYVDSGGAPPAGGCVDTDLDGILDDGGSDNYCENLQLRDALVALGCVEGTDFAYVWDENAGHNEAEWRARAPAILDLFEAL